MLFFKTDTDSTKWGSGTEAMTRALQETSVTSENEALIKTHHPALLGTGVNAVTELSGNKIWTVWTKDELIHTHAAGREVHVIETINPPLKQRGFISPYARPVPIGRLINPRRMLTSMDIATIRSCFPLSVGVRIYLSGSVIILFHNTNDMDNTRHEGFPWIYCGGLRMGFDVINVRPSAISTRSNQEKFSSGSRRCYGLKIRLPDGREAVTTPTHRHVRKSLKFKLGQLEGLVEWVVTKLMSLLERLGSSESSKSESRKGAALGKLACIERESDRTTATITTTYDEPSSILSYPYGYQHDLSLLTSSSSNIPSSQNLGGSGITGWANYEEALDGKPVFVRQLDDIASSVRALIEGTAYFWDKSDRVSASLFWRTEEDFDCASKNSTAVLCLGKLTDRNDRAVVFQSYGVPRPKYPNEGNLKLIDRHDCMKGGFVLPQEIRESQILHPS